MPLARIVIDSAPAHPTVVFDRRYLAAHDSEYLRTRVWHILAERAPQMPHFRGKLTEPQVHAVVEYLKASAITGDVPR